jgi:hypothetical protein
MERLLRQEKRQIMGDQAEAETSISVPIQNTQSKTLVIPPFRDFEFSGIRENGGSFLILESEMKCFGGLELT